MWFLSDMLVTKYGSGHSFTEQKFLVLHWNNKMFGRTEKSCTNWTYEDYHCLWDESNTFLNALISSCSLHRNSRSWSIAGLNVSGEGKSIGPDAVLRSVEMDVFLSAVPTLNFSADCVLMCFWQLWVNWCSPLGSQVTLTAGPELSPVSGSLWYWYKCNSDLSSS